MRMPFSKPFFSLGAFFALSLAAFSLAAAPPRSRGNREVSIGPEPSWILPVKYDPDAEAPPGSSSGGVYYLLSDAQECVLPAESYRRIAVKVLSESGSQTASDISADWDPEYQSLVFHSLRVIRGGVQRDALSSSAFRVVQRETEFERSMYDGRLSALASLGDVRSGDIIEYSFTVKGRNPVFDGKFSVTFDLAFSEPVDRLFCSVLHPAERKLFTARLGGAAEPSISAQGARTLMSWDLGPLPPTDEEDGAPSWFDAGPWVQIEEWKNWAEVASWAERLYAIEGGGGKAVKAEASRIAAANADPGGRILAAARFVQDEIRYLGIEAGEYSHRPEAPDGVLRRRSGDCKGKARLLSAILAELGVKSYPALTDSGYGKGLDALIASPVVFDHVVLAVETASGLAWIDPTMTLQRGALGTNAIPGCERALLARAGETGLREIPRAPGRMETTETFDLKGKDGEKGSLVVKTVLSGAKADEIRYTLATASIQDLADDYLEFYARTYPGIAASSPFHFEDDPIANVLTTIERYSLDASIPGKISGEALVLRAGTISGILKTARDGDRWTPYALSHPLDLVHSVEAGPLKSRSFKDESSTVSDPSFELDYRFDFNALTARITWSLKTLKDSVDPGDYAAYAKNVRRAEDLLEIDTSAAKDASEGGSGQGRIVALFLIALCALPSFLLIMAIFRRWNDWRKGRPASRKKITDYLDVPAKEAYSLFNPGGLVLLCTKSAEGIYDAAPIAWNCPLDYDPVTRLLLVCDTGHASYENLKSRCAFVLAVPGAAQRGIAERMGSSSGRDGDKYAALALRSFPGTAVDAMIPEGVSAWAECRLLRVVEEGTSAIVMGEVMAAKAIRESWKDRLHFVKEGIWYAPGRRARR
jgi:flavin reductase (DIM6/NTAB) family NADH-FMN oxidoreductase RutF/transglutaminase-like putative cysteine protease